MLNRFKHFKTYALGVAIVFVLALCTYTSVSAMTLTFDQLTDGGTLIYDGAGGPLVGSGIEFDSITGVGTPANGGATLTIVNGTLNFETGDVVTEGPDTWIFGSGGFFTLTGTVMDGATTVASGNLLTGSFTSNSKIDGYNNGSLIFFIGVGVDEKNPDLLNYYGVPSALASNFTYGVSNISADVDIIDYVSGKITANVTEADIVNSVPDASIMLLLGPSLLCLGMIGWRKFKSES
jgi:hypothetical protein